MHDTETHRRHGMTERDRMLAGEPYDPLDPELVASRLHARRLCHVLNHAPADASEERARVVRALLPHAAADVWIEPPFHCDYGAQVRAGVRVFFNFGCVVLDVADVTIGDRVLFGPAVQLYTATHPMRASERARGLEMGRPIAIGDDAWIGGAAVVCPGVTIGAGAVIGAGSVVTRDIPAHVFAAGNPCRVIRALEP